MHTKSERAARAAIGVVAGAPLGALLVATAILIPGLGVVLAAGPLLVPLLAGVAGGVVGGLVGALTTDGIPDEAARIYHEHVEHGDVLVTVLAGNHNEEHVKELLRESGGQEIGYFPRIMDTLQSIES